MDGRRIIQTGTTPADDKARLRKLPELDLYGQLVLDHKTIGREIRNLPHGDVHGTLQVLRSALRRMEENVDKLMERFINP